MKKLIIVVAVVAVIGGFGFMVNNQMSKKADLESHMRSGTTSIDDKQVAIDTMLEAIKSIEDRDEFKIQDLKAASFTFEGVTYTWKAADEV